MKVAAERRAANEGEKANEKRKENRSIVSPSFSFNAFNALSVFSLSCKPRDGLSLVPCLPSLPPPHDAHPDHTSARM